MQSTKDQANFNALFDKSKDLKDEANKNIQTNLKTALDKYQQSLKVFLKALPKYVTEKSQFALDWKVTLTPEEETKVKEHFATIFSNCSLVYLQRESPLIAYYNANFSIWCNESFYKAYLRKARAMIELQYVHEAQDLLKDLQGKPDLEQFQQEINDLLESIAKLIKEYSSPEKIVQFLRQELNWSIEKAYKGPYSLVNIPGRGRGVCATRDIARGEILLIEKGIIRKGDYLEFSSHFLYQLDNREDLKALYMNLFSCEDLPDVKDQKENKEVDEAYTKASAALNDGSKKKWKNFSSEEIDSYLKKLQCYTYKVNEEPGLFPTMCLFNHSCDPNTSLWTAGDMALMLAQRNIKKGEEIFIYYTRLMDDLSLRRAALLKYKFVCDCPRCQEKGEWKEKEPQLTGIRCPQCRTEMSSDAEGIFTCPKGCSKCDHSYLEAIDVKANKALDVLLECAEEDEDGSKFKLLLETLETIEREFGHYHHNRAYALRIKARYHAFRKEEKEFQETLAEILKVLEFFANPDFRPMITQILYEVYINFGRGPNGKELEALNNFGLSVEATKLLWSKSFGGK